jgi:hypothetical protein
MEPLARINGSDGEKGASRAVEGVMIPADEHHTDEGPSEETVERVATFLGQFAAALLKRGTETPSHFKAVPGQTPRIEPPTA